MKKLCCVLLMLPALFHDPAAVAQPVPRTTVVEHFTNTFCSVCASRNPGFYGNLANFPDVLHISYYPSAPYPSCPFNQMNKQEQDERAKYYDVYGATPRLVINGTPIPANSSYNDPAIFQTGQTSDFAMQVRVRRSGVSSGEATIAIKRVGSGNAGNLRLYALIAEDTVYFNANNGESVHYDKFNKSLTGISPLTVSSPIAVGDSVVNTFSFTTGSGWGRSRVTAILQDEAKNGLQAARSNTLPEATSVMPDACPNPLCMYPVPAKAELRFSALPPGYHHYLISNTMGQIVQQGVLYDIANPISLVSLQSGLYVITIEDGAQIRRGRFVKQ